ncbi:hypothetical protein niasHS_009362 [Heterodera schachtii]|uniref:Uncharacterized protein n=1 Tax=Heterodera schachtii TaxID=97005 RepID=A0ABD2JBU1_HETSC
MAYYYGGFKSESNCSCPNSQLIATKYIVAEYDSDDDHTGAKIVGGMRKFTRAGLTALTGFMTPATDFVLNAEEEICGDVVQKSLEVEFKCEQCGQLVHKTTKFALLVPNVTISAVTRTYTR